METDDSDVVYLYDWNEGREDIGDNGNATRAEHRVTNSNINRNGEIHMDGHCINNDDEYDDEEDMNFYDNETYYSNNGELSDEEMDEIDELYEE
jgi:hypothetical protein